MSGRHPFPYSLLPSGRQAGTVLLVLLVSLLAHLFIIEWARDSLSLVSVLAEDEDVMQVTLQSAPSSRASETPQPPARPPAPSSAVPDKAPPLLPAAPATITPRNESDAATAPVIQPAKAVAEQTLASSDTAANAIVAPAPAAGPDNASAVAPATRPAATDAALADATLAAAGNTPALFSRISLPPSADLSYDAIAIKGSSKVEGRGLVKWVQDGQQYSIAGEASVLFLSVLSYRSEGHLSELGIVPERYVEKRLGKSSTNTHFHRERQTISFSASTNSYPVKGGEQDRGSVFWQLAGLARGNPDKLHPGLSFELVIAGSRTADPWRVTVHGREPVALGQGNTDAWHMGLERQEGGTDYQLEVWLAPGQDWYPVKIMYVDRKGTSLGLSLSKLEKK